MAPVDTLVTDLGGTLTGTAKLPKTDPKVVYMGPKSGPFDCGHCRSFTKPSGCTKVQGTIAPAGCCNLFRPKKRA